MLPEQAGPIRSHAVLVGAATYTTANPFPLAPLPSVANNLDRLADLFRDPSVGGLPPENVHVLLDPESPAEVLREINRASRAASDTLIIYFAGHGLVSDTNAGLFLALPQAGTSDLHEAVRYDDVRRMIINSPARAKVAILDCCFSGQAMEGAMAGSDRASNLADQARIFDDDVSTYLLTATAETELALAPVDEQYTAFSGELISALSSGIPGVSDFINMDQLYFHMRNNLTAKDRPIPQNRGSNGGRSIVLARNVRGSSAKAKIPGQPRPRIEVPEGFEDAVTWRPARVAEELRRLRLSGSNAIADGLLTALSARWDSQEVASVAGQLRGRQQMEDLSRLLRGASVRPAKDLAELFSVLAAVEATDDVALLADTVGTSEATEVAAVCTALRGSGGAGSEAQADLMLQAARDAATTTERVIALVTALWSAGLVRDIETLIDSAASRLPATETIALADALAAAGRGDAATRFYVSALPLAAQQPASHVVTVLGLLEEESAPEQVERLLALACLARDTTDTVLELTDALWSAGKDGWASHLLQLAVAQPDRDLDQELIERLWDAKRRTEALSLVESIVLQGDLKRAVAVIDLLQAMGRPLDARKILDRMAAGPSFAPLLATLRAAGRHVEAERVLATFISDVDAPRYFAIEVRNLTFENSDGWVALVQTVQAEFTDEIPAILTELLNGPSTDSLDDGQAGEPASSDEAHARLLADVFLERVLAGAPEKCARTIAQFHTGGRDYETVRHLLRLGMDQQRSSELRAFLSLVDGFSEVREAVTALLLTGPRISPPPKVSAWPYGSNRHDILLDGPTLRRLIIASEASGAAQLCDSLCGLVTMIGDGAAFDVVVHLSPHQPAYRRVLDLTAARVDSGYLMRLMTRLRDGHAERQLQELVDVVNVVRTDRAMLKAMLKSSGERELAKRLR